MPRTVSLPEAEAISPTGPYDRLYGASDLLWSSRPGRMVRLASTLLPGGRALDVGCGDGKNLVYLEQLGWTVDGVDVSDAAITAARRRLARERITPRGTLRVEDSARAIFPRDAYDLVVCYGLYHCLNSEDLRRTHAAITEALRPGGLFAFAVFNDERPVPANHCTTKLFLRGRHHLPQLLGSWKEIAVEFGWIEEAHLPLVGTHTHALTWGLFKRATP